MHANDLEDMTRVLDSAPDPEIVALEAALRAAQLAADVGALDSLIDDELLFAGPDGQLATKAQDLEAHRSGAVRFREHEPQALRVRRVGPDVVDECLRVRTRVERDHHDAFTPVAIQRPRPGDESGR